MILIETDLLQLELRHLRSFVVTAEEQHFGCAADRLGIAQPSLSQQIKALETKLGLRLFHRIRRGVELSPAGSAFLPQARATLLQAQGAILAARRALRGELGQVEIGYSQSALLEPELPDLIRRFTRDFPHVAVKMSDEPVADQLQALVQQRLDIAFIRAPPGDLPRSLVMRRFSSITMTAVLPPDHPAARKPTFSLRDLAQDPFILPRDPPGVGPGHLVLELCRSAGFAPAVEMRISNLASVVGMVRSGLGVSLVPSSFAQLAWPGVIFRNLLESDARMELCSIFRANETSAPVRKLIDLAIADSAAERPR